MNYKISVNIEQSKLINNQYYYRVSYPDTYNNAYEFGFGRGCGCGDGDGNVDGTCYCDLLGLWGLTTGYKNLTKLI